jgi:hypothetical protein
LQIVPGAGAAFLDQGVEFGPDFIGAGFRHIRRLDRFDLALEGFERRLLDVV